MARLSDSKFIQRGLEASKELPASPVAPKTLAPDELAQLRGIGDARTRDGLALLGRTAADAEPVWFSLENGQRVYGYLDRVKDGIARVATADGAAVLVPLENVRKVNGGVSISETPSRELVAAAVTAKTAARSDMQLNGDPIPLGANSSGDYVLSVNYSTSRGVPSEADVRTFVASLVADARILDADDTMPGKLGIAIHVADVALDAEMAISGAMDGACGGEVTEVLDPEEMEKDAAVLKQALPPETALRLRRMMPGYTPTEQDVDTQEALDAANATPAPSGDPSGPAMRNPAMEQARRESPASSNRGAVPIPQSPNRRLNTLRPSSEVAEALLTQAADPSDGGKARTLVEKAITAYINGGGAKTLATSRSSFNTVQLLQAAMGVVQQSDPGLWKAISNSAQRKMDLNAPAAPSRAPANVPNPEPAAPAAPSTSATPAAPSAPAAPAERADARLRTVVNQPPPGAPAPDRADTVPTGTEPTLIRQRPVSVNHPPIAPGKAPGKAPPRQHIAPDRARTVAGARTAAFDLTVARALKSPAGLPKEGTAAERTKPGEIPTGVETTPATPGMEPAHAHVTAHMKIEDLVKRGSYVVATVTWDPKRSKSAGSMRHHVVSYVKMKASQGPGRWGDWGFIGRPHIVSFDEKSGSAQVAFQALSAGMSRTEIAERESAPELRYQGARRSFGFDMLASSIEHRETAESTGRSDRSTKGEDLAFRTRGTHIPNDSTLCKALRNEQAGRMTTIRDRVRFRFDPNRSGR